MSLTNKLKQLSIKNSVKLIVLSIFVILITLTTYNFNQKWDEHLLSKLSLISFNISISTNQLVYGLQKERGLSAGYIGSQRQTLSSNLQKQRESTNVSLKELQNLLLQYRSHTNNPTGLLLVNKIETNLKNLNEIRVKADTSDETFNIFDHYSDLISLLLNFSQKLSIFSLSSPLTNQYSSNSKLTWFLERSGQERGILNGILGQGSFTVPVLLKANGFISQQELLLNDFILLAKEKHLDQVLVMLNKPASTHTVELRQSVLQQAVLSDLLNKLHIYIGYGGLIHTFKNYVIRGQKSYEVRFHEMQSQSMAILYGIEQLPGLSQEARDQVLIISDTMEKYHHFIEVVQSMRAKGSSVAEIDKVVKVDDKPAFAAIEYLRTIITQVDSNDWWDTSTKRMDDIYQVTKEIELDLTQQINSEITSSYQAMLYSLAIFLVIFVFILLFAYYLIRYVSGSLTSIADQLKQATIQGNYSPLLSKPRNDEIGLLAEAFNNLIKERHESEAQLRILSQSIEQTRESMIIINKDRIIEYANPATEELTSYKISEIIGSHINLLQYESKTFQKIAYCEAQNDDWRGRAHIHKRNNGVKPIMLSISPISDDNGKCTHLIIAQQDISELEALEEQFYQAQKMESIGNLVGGIAHDFNNILAGMNGKLYLARKKAPQSLDIALSLMTDAEKLGFKAAKMIQQLLTFARRDIVKVEEIDLVQTIGEAYSLSKSTIPENIKISLDTFDGRLPIQGDSVQIHQILINLLNNAAQAVEGKEHAHISISVTPLDADEELLKNNPHLKSHDLAKLTVEDNGIGISKENIKHVFEPFYTTKEVGKGTGLGLSMVYGAINRHGGAVEVHSKPDSGTRIDIYFPISDELPDNKETVIEEELHQGKGETILIADDNRDVLETNSSILKDLGYNIIQAVDGDEVIKCFAEHSATISLVVLDVVMPNKGGLDAARKIRKISTHIPIIFMTGYDKEQTLVEDERVEGALILTKPVHIEKLASAIHNLIKIYKA